jgi:hypothetical protein
LEAATGIKYAETKYASLLEAVVLLSSTDTAERGGGELKTTAKFLVTTNLAVQFLWLLNKRLRPEQNAFY